MEEQNDTIMFWNWEEIREYLAEDEVYVPIKKKDRKVAPFDSESKDIRWYNSEADEPETY